MAQLSAQDQAAALYTQIQQAVSAYNRDPRMFAETEVRQLKAAADQLGIPMEVDFSIGRAVKKGFYELGEAATLGLLPDTLDPGALNTGESLAGFAGGLLGLAVPGGIAFKAGKGAVGLAGRLGRREGLGIGTELTAAGQRLAGIRGRRAAFGAASPGGRIRAGARARQEAQAANEAFDVASRSVADLPGSLRLSDNVRLAEAINSIKSKRVRDRLVRAMKGLEEAARSGTAVSAGRTLSNYPRLTGFGVGIPTFAVLNRALDEEYPQPELQQ